MCVKVVLQFYQEYQTLKAMEDNESPEPQPVEYNQSENKKDSKYETKAVKSNIARHAGTKQSSRIATIMDALNTESGGLLSLCSNRIKACVLRVPEDYIGLDEDDLVKKLKYELNYIPSPTIEALRSNFWMEFDRCQIVKATKMMDANIYKGACSEGRWLALLGEENNWHIWSYIITMPVEYDTNMNSLLNLATRRLRDILMIPLKTETGAIRDPKTLDVILKAAAMVDMRAKGGYVQKAETKNLTYIKSHQHVSHDTTIELSSKPIDQLTSSEIQKRLDILNSELAAYDQKKLAGPIEVESKPVEAESPDPLTPTRPKQNNAVKSDDGQY